MPENRRLLFVSPSAYPLGGVATWLDYLLPGLEEEGWQPTLGLVAGKYHNPDRYLEQHPFHRVVRITNPTGSQEGRVRALGKSVREVDPAIALSVNIPDLYLAVARLKTSERSGVKAVMTLHGIQADLLGDAHAFRSVLDAVICTNRLTCELVRDVAEVPEQRILYAPYGVEIPEIPARRKTTSKQGSPIRIVWVGRLDEEQKRVSDIPFILEALESRDQSFELWIVGGGPEEAVLRQRMTRWLESGQARMFGELPRERVLSEIYPQADCFLLISSWETGPIVIWEAMAAGLPVVTSEYVGSGPEGSLVDGENCLMFPVGDADIAARRIEAVADADLSDKLVHSGRELVRRRYSVATSVRTWDEVLDAVLRAEEKVGGGHNLEIPRLGRLDRWFGTANAEFVRELCGIRFLHVNAGGEWPHALNSGIDLRPQVNRCFAQIELAQGLPN